MPVNRQYPGKNDRKLTIFTLARFSERISKIWNKLAKEGAEIYILVKTGAFYRF